MPTAEQVADWQRRHDCGQNVRRHRRRGGGESDHRQAGFVFDVATGRLKEVTV